MSRVPWRAPPPYLQAWEPPPGIHKPEREVTLDPQGGVGSSVRGLPGPETLPLIWSPHTIGKSEKLKTEREEPPTPDGSLCYDFATSHLSLPHRRQ